MAVTIRLRRQGRTHRPFYRVVATDSRNPRDGRYVELLGWYNPCEAEEAKNLSLNSERVKYWIDQGASMSPKAEALVAKSAPSVIKEKNEREIAKRVKAREQRKTRKKAKA